jgi:PAS domain S-box-containing protein
MPDSVLPDRWLFDQMAQGMLLLDRERRVLAVNRYAQDFLAVREESVLGRHCWDVSGFSMCAEKCPFAKVLESGKEQKNFDIECLRGTRNTSVCLNLTPLRNAQGQVVAVMEIFQEASQIKELAERLKRKQALLSSEIERSRTLVNSIADGIYSVDLDMRLTSFSRSAEKMTGYREEEVLGLECRDVFHSSVCETDCPLQWTLKHQQPIQNCTATLVGKNGQRIPAFLSSDLLRDAAGQVCGCIGIIRDRSEVESLKAKLRNEYSFADFVGKSKTMVEIFERIKAVAATDTTVLIEGESGTGKEILARAIHYRSGRKAGPFVKVNCASLTESLLESELFGHEKGAFTGAVKDKPGRFERADGGTIFLDEIGDTSLALQAKLLRVLQEREFERVGGIKTLRTDVRVIAATNKDLLKEIERGTFREDLYYRLCVVPLNLPPLRERKEDIPLLVETFMQKFNARGKRLREISSRAMATIMAYDWPGNVRELENAIEHAYVTSTTERIERQFLPASLHRALPGGDPKDGTSGPQGTEAQKIVRALEAHRWRKQDAARELGMSRTTLWRRMRELGLG